MEKLTQKLIKLIVPVEITEEFEIEDIIETNEYIELVLRETNMLPQGIRDEPLELTRYTKIELLTFPVKGKQCRLNLLRKRWKLKSNGTTVTNPIPGKMYGLKIPEEFGVYLRETIEQQVTDIPRIARIMRICPKTLQKWYQKNLTDMESVASENMVVTGNIGKRLKIDEVCLHRGDFWTI